MADLDDKLHILGYTFVKDTKFATPQLRLELAIREFQSYAKLPFVAQVDDLTKPYYGAQLKSVPLPPEHQLLTESVTGAATARTIELMDIWIAQKYRCPVVIECWGSKEKKLPDGTRWWGRWLFANGKPVAAPYGENIWLWDDPKKYDAPARGRRMFVRDFTRRFDNHDAYKRLVDPDVGWSRLLLGRQAFKTVTKKKDGKIVETVVEDGPVADLAGRLVAIRVTPELLAGKPYDQLSFNAKITYRVIRAVSEAECYGYYDTINCWDKALMSIGLCHWTIAFPDKDKDGNPVLHLGELEALLAYGKKMKPNVLPKAITAETGLEPLHQWYDTDPQILNRDTRKYESQFSQMVLDNNVEKRVPMPFDRNRYNFLRSWHWFYRFQMATRTSAELQSLMWDMARFRLRDIRSAPAGLGIKNGAGAPAMLGDVFTSEQSMIWLMEWHVLEPNVVFKDGKPNEKLEAVIKKSKIDLTKKTSDWTDADELALLKSIKNNTSTSIGERFDRALACRDLSSHPHPDPKSRDKAPSSRRDSFMLDESGLGSSPF